MTRNPLHRLLWAVYPCVYDRLWDNALTATLAVSVVQELPRGRPVEEVGAGTGIFTERMAAAGLTVLASDPNAFMRRRFRRRLPSVPIGDCALDGSPPAGRAAHSIVAVNVLHLTRDPVRALAALRRRAGKGGKVVVVTPEPGLGVLRMAWAGHRHGIPRHRTVSFVVIHALLAPLIALGGGAAAARARSAAATVGDASTIRALAGVSQLLVYEGT